MTAYCLQKIRKSAFVSRGQCHARAGLNVGLNRGLTEIKVVRGQFEILEEIGGIRLGDVVPIDIQCEEPRSGSID